MDARHGTVRLVVLAVFIAIPLLGVSGVAHAKSHKHHHHSGGSGSGGTPAAMTVTASPNPSVEIGPSLVEAIVQVETSPSLAGDAVTLSISQLQASCLGAFDDSFQQSGANTAILDNDGNATFDLEGSDCAPGADVIDASLAVAPYYTATTTLQVNPPDVTPEGVTGYPNPEVEIGDAPPPVPAFYESTVIAIFDVETNPVYAEQKVSIDSPQLDASCGTGWTWIGLSGGGSLQDGAGPVTALPPATAILDDDGNAIFRFQGTSCAAGTWDVIADVDAGTRPTYVTTFSVSPPAPTI
jgi:hypothetical protein